MRKLFKNRYVRYGVIAAVIIIAVFLIISAIFGAGEITMFNSKSITDWKLGGNIIGISSPEDGQYANFKDFAWFDEDGRCGMRNNETGTTYYLEKYPTERAGKFCVTEFVTTDQAYSILGIRVGDSELDARALLLDYGYTFVAGGFNSFRAVNGSITVELFCQHGDVIKIDAYIK